MTIQVHDCPHCGGATSTDKDQWGEWTRCLNCGWDKDKLDYQGPLPATGRRSGGTHSGFETGGVPEVRKPLGFMYGMTSQEYTRRRRTRGKGRVIKEKE